MGIRGSKKIQATTTVLRVPRGLGVFMGDKGLVEKRGYGARCALPIISDLQLCWWSLI
jgi:hypothetical protein